MHTLATAWARALPSGVDTAAAEEAGFDLLGRWSAAHRRHHGIGHLRSMLDTIDGYAGHAADPDAVRLAAWFHDAVYDPRRADNEEASAALAEAVLLRLGVDPSEVVRLVRLTERHDPAPGDRDGELLCDADLAILGASPADYRQYAHRIRLEYGHVPDGAFRAGRVAVLRNLLGRRVLFRVPALRERLEARARENVTRELRALDAAPGPPGGPSAGAVPPR